MNKYEEELKIECPIEVVLQALKQGYVESCEDILNEPLHKYPVSFLAYDQEERRYTLTYVNRVSADLEYNKIYIDKQFFYLNEYKETWWLKEDMSM